MTDKDALKNGLRMARKNFRPAVLIWSLGFILVLAAACLSPVDHFMEAIVRFRKEHDPLFTILAFAFAGAILPYCIECLTSEKDDRDSWRGVAVKAVLWAINGLATKAFFSLLEDWFGEEAKPAAVLSKVLVDQFLYAALFTTPIITIVYLWAAKDLSFRETKEAFIKKSFRHRYVETYLANLSVWFVAAFIMFSAAGASLIFALILLTFWGFVLGAMARG